jgi:hypothetical protein
VSEIILNPDAALNVANCKYCINIPNETITNGGTERMRFIEAFAWHSWRTSDMLEEFE